MSTQRTNAARQREPSFATRMVACGYAGIVSRLCRLYVERRQEVSIGFLLSAAMSAGLARYSAKQEADAQGEQKRAAGFVGMRCVGSG